MKGLLYKEILLGKQWLIFLAVIEVVFSAVAIFMAVISDAETAMAVNILISFAMYSITGVLDDAYFSHDEKSKWCIFVSATPGTMKEQILCKYYIILLENLAILFIGYIHNVIAVAIIGDPDASVVSLYFLFFCISLFVKAFVNGFNVRFGSAAGKKILMIFVGLAISSFGLWFLLGDISVIMDNTGTFMEFIADLFSGTTAMWIIALIPYVACSAYYISYRISAKSYRKGVESYAE